MDIASMSELEQKILVNYCDSKEPLYETEENHVGDKDWV